MAFQRGIALLLTGAASLLLGASNVFAQPLAQAKTCPIVSNDVLSTVLNAPTQILDPDFGVTVDGADTECLFTAGGQMVLVRRTADYFPSSQPTVDAVDQLRLIVSDDLDYQPVAGVGDGALWATVRDRTLAPQRMGVLISKQGADALAVGVMDTPQALGMATILTQAVVAAQAAQP